MNPPSTTSRTSTLRLRWPFGYTLMLLVLIFLALGLLVELLARTPWAQSLIPVPSLGMENPIFEDKLFGLRARVQQSGPVRCLIVGNSEAQYGLDLEALDNGYQAELGRPLSCYNFSIDGILPKQIGAISAYLIESFHPQLIIYGLNDWGANFDYAPGRAPIIDSPWFQYQLGRFSWPGWLIEHSYAYRDYLRLKEVAPNDQLEWHLRFHNLDLDGSSMNLYFSGDPRSNITQPPNPVTEALYINGVNNFHLSPGTMAGFEQLAGLKTVQLLVVEIPTHPTYADFYSTGPAGKAAALSQIRTFFREHGILYWSDEIEPAIPNDEWLDRIHLNKAGATLLSYWLGSQLGKGIKAGTLTFAEP